MWAYDFDFDTTADGQQIKCLTVIDEYTRDCPGIDVAGSIRSKRVIDVLSGLISLHGAPLQTPRSNNDYSVPLACFFQPPTCCKFARPVTKTALVPAQSVRSRRTGMKGSRVVLLLPMRRAFFVHADGTVDRKSVNEALAQEQVRLQADRRRLVERFGTVGYRPRWKPQRYPKENGLAPCES